MIASGAKSLGKFFLSAKKQVRIMIAVLLTAALLVPSFSALAYSTSYPNTWKNTGNQAKDIAQVALTQVGYAETGSNHTKYNAWYYGSDNGVAWCGIFIAWCANQAGISTSVIHKTALASGFTTSNMSKNSFGCPAYSFGSTSAKVGDIIYVDSSGNGISNHVGLVVGVDSTYIYTVEGNSSSKVAKVKYLVSNGHRQWGSYTSSARILFYARPNYSGSSSTTTTTTTAAATTSKAKSADTSSTKSTTATASTAKTTTSTTAAASAAKTTTSTTTASSATATTTTETVTNTAATVNSSGTYSTGTYTLDTAMTLRSGPDTTYSALGNLRAGLTVKVTKVSGRFGYITTENGNSGWVSLKYATKSGSSASTAASSTVTVTETVTETASTVNSAGTTSGTYTTGTYTLNTAMILRSGPDTTYSSLGNLRAGLTVKVTKVSGRFGYITTETGKNGWVSLKYATKTGTSTTASSGTNNGSYTTGTYTVNTTMNMRSGADTTYTAIAIVPQGTSITVSKVSGRFGYTTVNGKTGWVSLKYATKTGTSTDSSDKTYTTGTYKLDTAMVVRSGPDTSSKQIGNLAQGVVIKVTKTSGRFGQITYKGQTAWISLKYATKQ